MALVDDSDYDYLMQWEWFAFKPRNYHYAEAKIDGKLQSMHRFIMQPPPGVMVDHRNGVGLDNRRENLRLCNMSQNGANRTKRCDVTSEYLGVIKEQRRKKNADGSFHEWITYRSELRSGDKAVYIGSYKIEEEAAMAYDITALKYHGEFASLNFPEKRDEYLQHGEEFLRDRVRKKGSMYRGVRWRAARNRWIVYAFCNKTLYRVGSFIDEIEAAEAYDIKALSLWGDKAPLNFPEKINDYLCLINKEHEEGVLKS